MSSEMSSFCCYLSLQNECLHIFLVLANAHALQSRWGLLLDNFSVLCPNIDQVSTTASKKSFIFMVTSGEIKEASREV